ncbi:hypothetical protein ACU8KH_04015 [Lachancea thermotolerans]
MTELASSVAGTPFRGRAAQDVAGLELWGEDEELTFPSFPKRFQAQAGEAGPAPAAEKPDDETSIEQLLHKDEALSTNTDFWREVRASSEAEPAGEPAGSAAAAALGESLAEPLSPLSPAPRAASETRLEDFIRDVGPLHAASPGSFQPDFQIKRLCFRDAEGKLALTAVGSSHVHKPARRHPHNHKKLLKKVLRRKSGLWEMASPSFAVAEFMLL